MSENKDVKSPQAFDLELVELGGNKYAYQHQSNSAVIAEIEWTEDRGVMTMTHTYVDDSLRGQGAAKKLLDQAATYAREKGLKMKAVCSYVVNAFDRSDAYDDVKVQ
ncbi:GNAT family N-acetyltransferase [Sporosarcina sp. GW1-11]|uniref:GNAT family N-acetyltransferase n=1 Tax=Sporosarcina sp. GW1-11 TaxID=2899126 RepID=UPI00294C5F39|nr:GNAT family N-acetyltransferase [Sporosarcina sp. GW1-11]MDV6378493.1 GNAT family N-acetyltransferase [Sporosarcina sp. GW1-11]